MKKLTKDEKSLLLAELARRTRLVKDLRGSLFPQQLAFIDDKGKLKTAQCTRRAGKSYCAGAYLTLEAIKNPGSTCLYIATTRDQAKRIMYKDILKVIDRKYDIGMKFNHTSLEVTFNNGSIIYLIGADSKPEEIEKALGQKYRLVIIDEAGSWKQDQRKMIHEVLEPACADHQGTICMISSPVHHTRTYFFNITYYDETRQDKYINGWSRHRWTWEDNPHIRDNMKQQIERILRDNPRAAETPHFKMHYCNQWVVDLGNKVYKYDEAINSADTLPQDHNWAFYLGLDLGYNDETAFVVAACAETDPTMYFVEVYKEKEMDITAVADRLKYFHMKYMPVRMVVDGASKQAVMELRNRHGFPLEAADKMGKEDIIEIMNADFLTGKIKLLPAAWQLAEEYETLIWEEKGGRRIEHTGCPNHAADGALYTWRKCFHYAARIAAPEVDPNSDEGLEIWWERQARIGLNAKKQNEDFALRDWGKDYGYN